MKLVITALICAALFWLVPQSTPINNLEAKVKPATAVQASAVVASAKQVETPTPVSPPPQLRPHEDLMQAAGISSTDYQAVDYIVSHESGWCATKSEGEIGYCPDYHGYSEVGYGLCQSTPAIKMATAGSDWATNSITQLKWCSSYADSRYGGWKTAYNHWLITHNW